jgi:hypothetical protein
MFGSLARIVTWIMATKHVLPCQADVEVIVQAAFAAFRRGAARTPADATAIEAFRSYFVPKACQALSEADGADRWDREKPYVLAYAEAMGRRAATLAGDDRRAFIRATDVHEARVKLRGYLPVAGRWCPL